MRARIVPAGELSPATHVIVIDDMDLSALMSTETAPQIIIDKPVSNFCDSTALDYLRDYLKALPPEEPLRDWSDEIRQGIEDFHAWLNHRVSVILARRSRSVRVVFQPCWRAGRWKSLT